MNLELYNKIVEEMNEAVKDAENMEGVSNENLIYSSVINIYNEHKKNIHNSAEGLSLFCALYEITQGYDLFNYIKGKASNHIFIESKYLKVFENLKSLFEQYEKLFEPCMDEVIKSIVNSPENLKIMDIINRSGPSNVRKKLNNNEEIIQARNNYDKYSIEGIDKKIISTEEKSIQLQKQLEEQKEKELKLQKELNEQRQKEIELKEKRKDKIIDAASEILGVDKEVISKKIDLDISDIAFSNKLIKTLSSEESKIGTFPKTFLNNILIKIKKKRFINSLVFDVEKIDNIKVLKITKKDDFFDKIASGKKPIMGAIINSAKRKYNLLKQWSLANAEMTSKIKKALISKNEEYKQEKKSKIETQNPNKGQTTTAKRFEELYNKSGSETSTEVESFEEYLNRMNNETSQKVIAAYDNKANVDAGIDIFSDSSLEEAFKDGNGIASK